MEAIVYLTWLSVKHRQNEKCITIKYNPSYANYKRKILQMILSQILKLEKPKKHIEEDMWA